MVKKHEGPQPYSSPGKCKLKQQLDPSNSPITVTKIKKPDNIKDQSTCGPTETLKRCQWACKMVQTLGKGLIAPQAQQL